MADTSIHIFTSEVLPVKDVPATGGALRCLQLIEGLKLYGFDVTYSMPIEITNLGKEYRDRFSEEEIARAWTFENQEEILRELNSDIGLWANLDTKRIESLEGVYFVADLHGPSNLETSFFETSSLKSNTRNTIERLANVDYCTTVSKWQRSYWWAYLAAAGFSFQDLYKMIGIVPVSIPVPEKSRVSNPPSLQFISAGGFYPWQSTLPYLSAAAEVMEKKKKGEIHIYGAPTKNLPNYTQTQKELERISKLSSVFRHGYVSRPEVLEAYDKAAIALDVYAPNVERALAMTTRTMEYLAVGLPVVYGDYAELARNIEKSDAGWVVPVEDMEEFQSSIEEILELSPEEVKEKGQNAQNLIREKFSLKNTLADLAEYCQAPFKTREEATLYWSSVLPEKSPYRFLEVEGDKIQCSLDLIPRTDGYGFVDLFTVGGNKIKMRGWAAHPEKGVAAEALMVLLNDRVIYIGNINCPRLDIKELYGAEYSGFECQFYFQLASPQESCDLKILGLFSDKKAVEIPHQIPQSELAKLKKEKEAVLVFAPDLLPYPGLPTVGSGLRAWGLGQGLKSHGFEVLYSMPRHVALKYKEKLPSSIVDISWTRPEEVVQKVRPDAVLVSGWPIMGSFIKTLDIPLIVDQHGPHILERKFDEMGTKEQNEREKCRALAQADYFTCAGDRQKSHFLPYLKQAGWAEEEIENRFASVPFSLAPETPEREPEEGLIFVYSGAFLPWQNPKLSLDILMEILREKDRGRLWFFGGKHPTFDINTGIFKELEGPLQKHPQVEMFGFIPRDELIEHYAKAHVAFDLMEKNPERELAFTSRTVEYLWAGLPVVYNDYSELTDYIREYNAGWIVDPSNEKAIRRVLEEIYTHPEEIEKKSENARRLVREKLNWDQAVSPIADYINNLSFRPGKMTNREFRSQQGWSYRLRYGMKDLGKKYLPQFAKPLAKKFWNLIKD